MSHTNVRTLGGIKEALIEMKKYKAMAIGVLDAFIENPIMYEKLQRRIECYDKAIARHEKSIKEYKEKKNK